MKDRIMNILQGATLLATVLAVTGYADASSRFDPPDSKFPRHTVQDAVGSNPHTVQDGVKIPENELPRDDDEYRWEMADPTALRVFTTGSRQEAPGSELGLDLDLGLGLDLNLNLGLDFELDSGVDVAMGPHLALDAWVESIDATTSAGPAFDPIALPAAGQPEFQLPSPENDTGHRFVAEAMGASIPGPGALPLLGLGTLALIGRRRRA